MRFSRRLEDLKSLILFLDVNYKPCYPCTLFLSFFSYNSFILKFVDLVYQINVLNFKMSLSNNCDDQEMRRTSYSLFPQRKITSWNLMREIHLQRKYFLKQSKSMN